MDLFSKAHHRLPNAEVALSNVYGPANFNPVAAAAAGRRGFGEAPSRRSNSYPNYANSSATTDPLVDTFSYDSVLSLFYHYYARVVRLNS